MVGGTKTYNLHSKAAGTNRIAEVDNVSGTAMRTLTYRTGGDLYQDQIVGGDLLTYSPNVLKRPVVVQRNGWTQAEYGYNGFGQRVWRKAYTVFGMVTGQSHYVYDQDGRLLAEHDASTHAVLREYVWLDDQLLAEVDGTASPVKTYFVHAGQIGEPLVMTDSTKAKVWDGFVDPYGIAQTFTTATATIDLRLPGQWQMGEIGPLYQNGMREYDPTLARYIETDPLGLAAGQNVYAYVDGSPLELFDIFGLCPDICADLRGRIFRNSSELTKEFNKYDPIRDAQGGEPMKYGDGFTKPYGHYTEMKNLQRGLKKDINKYNKICRNDDDNGPGMPPLPRSFDEQANRAITKSSSQKPGPSFTPSSGNRMTFQAAAGAFSAGLIAAALSLAIP